MIDCIIVGQGLAGTCLALDLISHGWECKVYDPGSGMTSSRVAAGVMNPVTGRRFVKTWNAGELWALAPDFYAQCAQMTGSDTLCEPKDLWLWLPDAQSEEEWLVRSGDPDYTTYIDGSLKDTPVSGLTAGTYAAIHEVMQVDLPYLVDCGRSFLDAQEALVEELFDLQKLELIGDGVRYKGTEARYLIFAEGHRVVANPWFNWLPMHVTRGELLICEIPELVTDAIIKGPVSLVPMEGDLYWVGATYTWDPEHGAPSTEGKNELSAKLRQMLDCPFQELHHLAAIRPTTRDRRPMIGWHPEHPQLCVLNGFGTKGASLAPWCTRLLSGHLREGDPIPVEVDILRHWSR